MPPPPPFASSSGSTRCAPAGAGRDLSALEGAARAMQAEQLGGRGGGGAGLRWMVRRRGKGWGVAAGAGGEFLPLLVYAGLGRHQRVERCSVRAVSRGRGGRDADIRPIRLLFWLRQVSGLDTHSSLQFCQRRRHIPDWLWRRLQLGLQALQRRCQLGKLGIHRVRLLHETAHATHRSTVAEPIVHVEEPTEVEDAEGKSPEEEALLCDGPHS